MLQTTPNRRWLLWRLAFVALALALASCHKEPDWSGKERDPQLVGVWQYVDPQNYVAPIDYYEFRADETFQIIRSSQVKYHTERGRLHTYTPRGGKVNPEKLMRHYTIEGDRLTFVAYKGTSDGFTQYFQRKK